MTTYHSRRLPHFHAIAQPIFLTWRLAGSLPGNRYFPPQLTSGKAFAAMDRLLDDALVGPKYLRRPDIACLIMEAIQRRHGRDYDLHAYAIMSNHVHLLVTPRVVVSRITHSIKRFTAKEANVILGLTGNAFWQDESYDRLVRNQTEFLQIARYIENNPVKAGLVANPEDYPWSSAGLS